MGLPETLPRTVPVLDVESLFARLPAAARANFEWAKKPILDGLERLCIEPLTDQLVLRIAEAILKPITTLLREADVHHVTDVDGWRAQFVDEIENEERLIAEFIADNDSVDTLRWVLGILRSFFSLLLTLPRADHDEAFTHDDGFKAYMKAIVALMGAGHVAKSGGDPERARDLLDIAFLALCDFRDTLRRDGVFLSAFPSESVEERRRGFLDGADRLRKALSDDEWQALNRERLGNLR